MPVSLLLDLDPMNNNEKLNIFFLVPHMLHGGVGRTLLRLLTDLSLCQRYKITVISKKAVTDLFFSDFFCKQKIELICPPIKQKPEPKNLLKFLTSTLKKAAFDIRRRSLLQKADVVIDYHNGSWSRLVTSLKKPRIVFLHGGIPWFKSKFGESRKDFFDAYDKVVVLSDSFLNYLQTEFPTMQEKFQRIYNPIDVGEVLKLAKDSKQTGIGRYFVFLARLDNEKDHYCVINAFKLLTKTYPDAKIYFIGDGPLSTTLKNTVKEYSLERNIIFTGLLNNPYGYLKDAIANVLSSPSEGFANTLIEAAALRVLNISSSCPNGPPEILLDGKGGLLFPPGDSEKLYKHLKNVWEDQHRYDNLVETEFDSLSRFEHDKVVKQVQEVIDEVYHMKKIT